MTTRTVSMRVTNEDLQRATELGNLIGRKTSRTEVVTRALHLLFWAFKTKGATELVAFKGVREVARLKWSDGEYVSQSSGARKVGTK